MATTMSIVPNASMVAATSWAGAPGSVMSAAWVATSAPRSAHRRRGFGEGGLTAGGQEHPDPLTGQGLGGGPPQAARAGDYQRHPAFDSQIHPEPF